MIATIFLSPSSLNVVIIAAMLLLWFVGYVLRAAVRTRRLPLCWNCGASKVRRSLPQHLLDTLVGTVFLNPYRCQGCRVRFYGLRSGRQVTEHATNGSVWWGT
jgi:hypothetical protein